MKGLAFALSLTIALALGSSAAIAQYPQPAGNLNLAAAKVAADTGDEVPLECTVMDAAGNLIVGAPCTFTIEGEPEGSDAAVGSKVVTKITGADGVARTMLKTGSVPGTVVISATSGSLRSVVVVSVGVLPPAAPITPPSTGDAGLAK